VAKKTITSALDFLTVPVNKHFMDDDGVLQVRDERFPVVFDISGAFTGTITLQWKLQSEPDSDFRDIPRGRFTTPTAGRVMCETSGWAVRAGFKAGELTAGTAKVILR
jgi:hypothetical protein